MLRWKRQGLSWFGWFTRRSVQYSKAEVSIPPQRQRLKPLSNSLSTCQGTARRLVGFSLLELLDNCFSCWLIWYRNFRFQPLILLTYVYSNSFMFICLVQRIDEINGLSLHGICWFLRFFSRVRCTTPLVVLHYQKQVTLRRQKQQAIGKVITSQ